MKPYHETDHGVLYNGDCLDVLRDIPDNSVNCCVTSPPYWGLRDYGTAEWVGGCDPCCDHKGKIMRTHGYVNENCGTGSDVKNKEVFEIFIDQCPKCGARRKDKQLGLERTPEEYVANMVQLFREVRRVLRKDGTLWLNLGDSYADKSLVGIPWRVAFALQSNGWYLRQDIIWHKPNPMPESVTDRCTKSHEYVFLMSKSAKYYYDAEAIKEPIAEASKMRLSQDIESQIGSDRVPGKTNGTMKAVGEGIRNKRSVWIVTTKPCKEAHFATFPRDLIRPMIQAGCPVGGIVLDPFMGSGTTALEAISQGKRYIGIDLNPEYIDIAARRIDAELEQTTLFDLL